MELRATAGDVAGQPVLGLSGPVDLATVPALHNALARLLLDHPGGTIAVDLDGVDSLDDVGLGVLLGAAGRARVGGGDLIIVCGSDALLQRFALTGFDRAVTIVRTLSA